MFYIRAMNYNPKELLTGPYCVCVCMACIERFFLLDICILHLYLYLVSPDFYHVSINHSLEFWLTYICIFIIIVDIFNTYMILVV